MKATVSIALVLVVASLSEGFSVTSFGNKAVSEVEALTKDMFKKFSNPAGICKMTGPFVNCCVKDLIKNNICLGFIVDPVSFSVDVSLSVNDRTVVSQKISGKNPPPFCVPIPHIPLLKVCIEPYNLSYVDPTFNICVAMGAKIFSKEIARVNLNSIQISRNGDIGFAKCNSNSSAIVKIDTAKVNPLLNKTINPAKEASAIKDKIFG